MLKRSRDLGRSFFRFLFADGRLRIVLFYLLLILAYGGIEALARATQNFLIYDIVKVLIATSAFMHYYYDGFMWKVGKKEIRQNLIDEASAEGPGEKDLPRRGWNALVTRWQNARAQWTALSYGFETGKQVLYFGVPILFLAWTDAQYALSDVNAKEYLSRLAPSVAKAQDDLGVAYSQQGISTAASLPTNRPLPRILPTPKPIRTWGSPIRSKAI